jgi:hypothetical protein
MSKVTLSSEERKIKKKEYDSNWYLNNKEYMKQYSANWYLKNKEKRLHEVKEWSINNPDKRHMINLRRRIKRGSYLIPTPEYLNQWSEGLVGHHINKNMVIYIPITLHRSVKHSVVKNQNMKEINRKVIEWFESINLTRQSSLYI